MFCRSTVCLGATVRHSCHVQSLWWVGEHLAHSLASYPEGLHLVLLLESPLDLKAQNFQGYKGKHWQVHVGVCVEGAQGLGDTDDTVVI